MISHLVLCKPKPGMGCGDPCVAQWMDILRELPKQIPTSVAWVICDNEY